MFKKEEKILKKESQRREKLKLYKKRKDIINIYENPFCTERQRLDIEEISNIEKRDPSKTWLVSKSKYLPSYHFKKQEKEIKKKGYLLPWECEKLMKNSPLLKKSRKKSKKKSFFNLNMWINPTKQNQSTRKKLKSPCVCFEGDNKLKKIFSRDKSFAHNFSLNAYCENNNRSYLKKSIIHSNTPRRG
eukprot:snap_masked-scaffold_9-processed-gene-13.79-mRNA-1 protein AED:1.00 eAED:1.00 QI:0/-1/0/0/-1/1/1/0/187